MNKKRLKLLQYYISMSRLAVAADYAPNTQPPSKLILKTHIKKSLCARAFFSCNFVKNDCS